MKTPQKIQPSFDDEISSADIIHFFKSHKKMILIFVIIGTLLGSLYGNFTAPVYKGSVFISPAKIEGAFVINPVVAMTKLKMNSFYSKETFLNCNLDLYKDKDIDYDISNLVKASFIKGDNLIELRMQDKNKTVIKDCLNSVADDIRKSQNIIADPLIQLKNYELKLLEETLKISEKYKSILKDMQIKELKINSEHFSPDLLSMNIILLNSNDNNVTISQINKLKTDLLLERTRSAGNIVPISIEKKSFPSLELGSLLGLFLGLCLGILLALIKQIILKVR